jgi:S-adenosylmethionine hydrolase
MKPIISAVFALAAAMLVSCAQRPQAAPQQSPSAVVQPRVIEGTVTRLSSSHGNVYTSIRPDQYESLGLVAGRRIHIAFGDTELALVIGRDYTDVSSGTPLAVLHREGLTFAIRDGNFSRTYGIAVGQTFRISLAGHGE